jgi:Cu(I)/Ag(I) efflux system membrane protein CusA/SilA
MSPGANRQDPTRSPLGRLIGLCLEYKLLVAIGVLLLIFGGIMMAPFDWSWRGDVVQPVPVDAIPNLGENQQVIFTEWPGQSPEDVEEQLTYPLTSALLGTKGVKSVRSNSLFGFSSIYVIFDESEEFYDSRTRLLEKVNSLVEGKDFPEGTRPQLGPDATALGQVYWYTLEARDEDGRPTGGWDLDELRTVQDYTVRYALTSAQGVSEVASIGGYVREYQIDLDPDTMRLLNVSLKEVYTAVSRANTDVGAKTIELNHVEYFVRGVGFIQSISQLEHLVIKNLPGKQPVLLKQVATVALGPAQRRGALDKNGVEAVGGVVVCRFDANPLETIHNVQKRIDQLQSNLSRKILIDWTQVSPEVVQAYAAKAGFGAMNEDVLNQVAWLKHWDSLPTEHRPAWATLSQVHIVPFYDRTELIAETLGTLESALTSQILVTFIVIVLMVLHWRSSFLIGGMLPLALCLTFIAMRVLASTPTSSHWRGSPSPSERSSIWGL